MGKKKKKTKTMPNPMDCIPKYSQHPRSSPPKRRTDFSVFRCTPSLFNKDSSSDTHSGVLRLSKFTTNKLHEREMEGKQFSDGKLVRCSYSLEHRSVCSSEYSDVLGKEADSSVQDERLKPGSNRDASNEKTNPDVYPVNGSNSLLIPGRVVWARTDNQMWWPAETNLIIEEGSALSQPASDGRILVQFYGNRSSAWINPMTDISPFENSFEERSANSSRDFHKALKQALKRKEQVNSYLSSDRHSPCNQQNHSCDKWTSCTSSTTMDDFVLRGRGKRERKRKVHFDEVTFPLKSQKKSRRLKIMRYLGLVAPVGSPF
ncbi:unnamed protein product [Sphenostylis stenocarpa]|uniref:PWWP domain-containing protein n=1 Tax=Sphenostylis stenocarpa TaxID=92480 RepID=A0AA86VZS8_9FABA|nr:unnamed protein product [Sphenostylis stenocarpa]